MIKIRLCKCIQETGDILRKIIEICIYDNKSIFVNLLEQESMDYITLAYPKLLEVGRVLIGTTSQVEPVLASLNQLGKHLKVLSHEK